MKGKKRGRSESSETEKNGLNILTHIYLEVSMAANVT